MAGALGSSNVSYTDEQLKAYWEQNPDKAPVAPTAPATTTPPPGEIGSTAEQDAAAGQTATAPPTTAPPTTAPPAAAPPNYTPEQINQYWEQNPDKAPLPDPNLNPELKSPTAEKVTSSQVTMDKGDTVEGRVEGIIKSDSPLMQLAKTQAKQQANQKGLLNSSMAVGAAQNAVYNAATPIAQQDARTSADIKLANQKSANETGMFNAGEQNSMYKLSQQGQIDLKKIAANIEGDSRLLNEKGEIDIRMSELGHTQNLELETRKGEIQEGLIGADADAKSRLQAEAANIAIKQSAIDHIFARDLTNLKGKIDLMMQTASAEDAKELAKLNGEIDIKLKNIDAANAIRLETIRSASDERQAQISGEYQVLINNNGNAATASREFNAAAAAIWADPDMTLEAKNSQITKLETNYVDTLEMISMSGDEDYTAALG